MSLRAFHLFFIAISAALWIVVAAWASGRYRVEHAPGYAIATVAAIAAAVGLVSYAMVFRRKTRNLS